MVFDDMSNAIQADNAAVGMYGRWNSDAFQTYVVLIGRANGCSFQSR